MSEKKRVSPDELLADIEDEAKGKLTVFLGAAAGVGKTYAMLEVARERLSEGIKLSAGWVEPHARPETMALMEGIPQIAPKEIEYHGKVLKEMDLDEILSIHPQIVLVDELAHTNVPSSRHLKRYQDVEELLAAGIDVYTTVNIQHVESFNDIVAKITGVTVRETVPDSILEHARIQLIDISTEALIQRLEEGKIYVPNQAKHALDKFFRPGNINALRELSMRFAAQRVDRQLESYMRVHGIEGPWPASERVMVCISSSPFGERLIRMGKRIAVGMKAELLVVYIDTPSNPLKNENQKDQLSKSLHLAQELDAETISLSGNDVVEELLEVAQKRNVTQIIIGKPGQLKIRERFSSSIVEKVLRQSQNISVHVIPGDGPKTKEERENKKTGVKKTNDLVPYLTTFVSLAVITVVAWLGSSELGLVNTAMLYLLPVLLSAGRYGKRVGIFTSIVSVITYDFFTIPPVLTFTVADLRYLVSFAIMILIGYYLGNLSTRLRIQLINSRQRESQTAALYSLSREIAAVSDLDFVLESVVKKVSDIIRGEVVILVPETNGQLSLRSCSNLETAFEENERAVATWVFENNQTAGKGTDTLGGAKGFYLPLVSEQGICGVLGVQQSSSERYLSAEKRRLLDAFASLTALAIARISLVEKAREAQLLNESEKLRTALLNSISHDLRTPLASMIGAVTSLIENDKLFDVTSRQDLLETIKIGAMRMNKLVNNLLDMARLESDMLKLNKEWCEIDEIIKEAIKHIDEGLENKREIICEISNKELLVNVDFILIKQVLTNLLDNAMKYSKPDSRICIIVRNNEKQVEVSVRDWGLPIPPEDLEHIFDKFYRVRSPRQISGTGLGLAISKGIVELHGGKIQAENNSEIGGVTISFTIPLSKIPPRIPVEVGDDNE
ncbi:osmosensitive K+ channel histidine kinase [Desulfosporosinus acidiphilus SJ4]|uniref:histidine kinase n=1 Tax=Desulfosporosinus acidiphilus (strain DSM 22704 / JCM 16185 / SJ4) TaxID=646529 RepID=I4D2C8_DESAJ|nr:sensor histidine kinase KdpD [Desulfosporosinus acidiphilus]AFM39952.1 osmosensitive K+ channel histidine kinase [Desulfosporosinus acidiphilus SJ4]